MTFFLREKGIQVVSVLIILAMITALFSLVATLISLEFFAGFEMGDNITLRWISRYFGILDNMSSSFSKFFNLGELLKCNYVFIICEVTQALFEIASIVSVLVIGIKSFAFAKTDEAPKEE